MWCEGGAETRGRGGIENGGTNTKYKECFQQRARLHHTPEEEEREVG